MTFDPYLFSLFVALLLGALLLLYRRLILNARGAKPQAGGAAAAEKEKEERLFRLYQNIEEMMDNFEGYVEDTRDQMEALKAGMQQQEAKLTDLLRRAEATEAKALAAVEALRTHQKQAREVSQPDPQDMPAAQPPKRGRQDAIRDLLSKGMTVEQIAQKLELSINEVRLVVYGLMSKGEKNIR